MTDIPLTSLRETLEFLRDKKDLLVIDREVDPYLEVAGITKAVDNSFALLFTSIRGYPGTGIAAGLFSRSDRVARVFGIDEVDRLKPEALERIRSPLPPRVVSDAPCQEVVQTRDLNVLESLPVTQHSRSDPGRILSGGVMLTVAPGFGRCISYKRVNFRGADWASLMCVPGSHADQILARYASEGKRLPVTLNISPSPAVLAVAAGGLVGSAAPLGSDEVAIAGALQRVPVDLCPAKTVDAFAIASSEWVIEGYLDTGQVVWESEEAEQRKDFSTPFLPEYHGYLGRAQTTYRFQATAITRRRDRPLCYLPLAHSFESPRMQLLTNRAYQWGALRGRWPRLIRDINCLDGMKGRFGMAVQVRKRGRQDDGRVKDIIQATFDLSDAIRMVVVVDEDVDIYSSDEIIWALCTRTDARHDLTVLPPGRVSTAIRAEEVGPFAPAARMGFDATVPFAHKSSYDRGGYPRVSLGRWLTRKQVAKVRARQGDYARLLAEKRV